MMVSPKQERSQIRTIDQLLQCYDLEAIASIQKATENNTIGLNKTNATLEQFVVATVGTLNNMQSQIDGNISTWFYTGKPTLENMPANEWGTTKDKDAHLGDLYYDKDTGYGYRFSVTDGTYGWIKLTDNDVVEALAIANAAQDTADGKRRVFTDTPSPPYDVGDLWFKSKEIYICSVAKSEGSAYAASDFGIATKYTDDTRANEVANDLAKNYSTTVAMNSAISKSASEILLTVAGTYATKNELTNEVAELEELYTTVSLKASGLETIVSSHTTKIDDLGARVDETNTVYTQLSNKFSWIVKSGTSSTNFTLTDRMAELTADIVSLNAKVKVNGDMIVDGSVTAEKVDVKDLFSQNITATGTITGLNLVGATIQAVDIRLDIPSGSGSALKIYNQLQSHSLYSADYIRFYDDKNNVQRTWIEGINAKIHLYNGNTGKEYVTISGDNGITVGRSDYTAAADILTVHGPTKLQSLTVQGMMNGNTGSFSGMVKGGSVKTTAGADLDTLNSKAATIGTITSTNGTTIQKGYYFAINNILVVAGSIKANSNIAQYAAIAKLNGTPVKNVYLYDKAGNRFYIDESGYLCIYKSGGATSGTTYEFATIV